MRISDWSSYVCSSGLGPATVQRLNPDSAPLGHRAPATVTLEHPRASRRGQPIGQPAAVEPVRRPNRNAPRLSRPPAGMAQIGAARFDRVGIALPAECAPVALALPGPATIDRRAEYGSA